MARRLLQPFSQSRDNYNDAYAYFLKTCSRLGLRAAFCTSDDITGPGSCSRYWLYQHGTWKKVNSPCYAQQIFDKLSPVNQTRKRQRQLLFSSELIFPFNDPYLSALFFDKLQTYRTLADFAIPSVTFVTTSKRAVARAVRQLRKLSKQMLFPGDYTGDFILKDRYGAGGNNIHKITKDFEHEIFNLVNANKNLSFILQPFMSFSGGYSHKGQKSATDIRLIYQNGEIIQTYIRMAKPGDFRCNEHQGATLLYVNKLDISNDVIKFSDKIVSELNRNNSLFALDFIVSDHGNIYFLEGNIGPGLDWNPKRKKNELMSKQLIRNIVKELVFRSANTISDNGLEYQNKPLIPIISPDPIFPLVNL